MSKRLILLTSFFLVLSVVCTASAQPTGQILFEYWFDIGGTAVGDLTGAAGYPDSPDDSELRDALDGPVDWTDNYGSRARGFLYPPADGDYSFWIAGDDYEELYLSTDDDPANAVMIAEVPGWTNHLEWGKYPEQQSAPITLVGGQKYYIESLMKEGGGGDSMAVGWTGPEIGDEITVIAGDYLSPVLRPAARKPVPADGTIDYDGGSVEWESGDGAVLHKVYLSTDATIDDADLAVETDLTIYLAALDPGMEYYWRVDEVDADGVVTEGKVWSFTTLPLEAHFPSPADGARDIESGATLSWTGGKGVIMHDVYFGTDEAAVAAGDPSTFKGKVMVTSYDPGPLELFTTYYWKVDEFSVTGTNPGPVWSFSTPGYIIIQSGASTLDYDNTADPFVSELALDVPADLRYGGVGDLTLRFQGKAPSGVSYDEATGTYTITGGGHDIWDNADDFHFAYRELTGDATIVARVVDNGTGSNTWAKGGVMIRQSIDAGSSHSYMPITGGGGNGASFQGRPVADGGSINSDSGEVVAPPYWVKLERVGNDFSGFISPDGVTWTQLGGANTVEMTDPVLIGLAVTSHQTGELRTFTFDNVDIVGDISADTMSTDVGDDPGGNAPAPIYVALEDSSGAVASVAHGNPAATNIETPRQWTIPLDKFKGVDATSAAKLYIGVGDGQPGGTGSITIEDVFVVKPDVTAGIASWEAAAAAGSPGYIATNVADALVDIGQYGGEQTYEFVVRSNPDETEASMALIGRRQFGDTQVGLKFDQWNNTGEYGATVFGVVDLYYGIANNPGVDTHLVFVSSETTGTTALYVNGVYQASVDSAISLSGLVGIGYGAQGADGSDAFDNFDGDIFGAAIYDRALSDAEIAANSNAFFAPATDVTKPGDIVQGIPTGLPCGGDSSANYSPCGELPPLVIDDNSGTKYLNFGGNFDPDEAPSGFQVTPLDGPTVVTGLTFTTANDAEPRDPIAFELYGSNVSIDGPYELIASGDIVDFAQATAWPRFTKNETPIKFDNSKAYSHYQVLFTAIRDAANANSMQIAEVELLGVLAADGPLAASYEFENDAADVSGNGLNGTLMGDPVFVEGPAGMALQLDGVDDYVDLGNPSSLDFGTGDFTIAAWINMTAIERGTVFAKGGDNSGGIRYTLAMGEANDNKMTLTTDDDSDKRQALGGTVVNDGAWHHVVGMRKGNMSLVYVDGAFDGSIDLPEGYDLSGSSQHNALIGAITSHTDGSLEKYFMGMIDDVQIYRRALSDDEVAKLAGVSAAGAGFSDDFNRADGDLGNDWTTQADGTIEVKIVDNEVLIAGEQATDWARSGLSRQVGDETIISFDFKGDDSFNVHVRIDDAATDAFLEIYTWGGPLIHANSEDGSWPGWTNIEGSEVVAGEYNNLVLEQIGTDFMVTLNDVAVATLTNAALTDISTVLFSSDAAAGTVGSIRIDNVVLSGP